MPTGTAGLHQTVDQARSSQLCDDVFRFSVNCEEFLPPWIVKCRLGNRDSTKATNRLLTASYLPPPAISGTTTSSEASVVLFLFRCDIPRALEDSPALGFAHFQVFKARLGYFAQRVKPPPRVPHP